MSLFTMARINYSYTLQVTNLEYRPQMRISPYLDYYEKVYKTLTMDYPVKRELEIEGLLDCMEYEMSTKKCEPGN